ncbi:MAG: protein kinase [Bacteroidales bacterium]|jgi:serine/threonine protein kinase|nr:protein kinase [Bacteroidales bacterium]
MNNHVQRCDFHADDIIDDKYRIEKTLGEGAFGKVFKVKDQSGQVYALKLLKLWEIQYDLRQQLVARFNMEYETGLIDSHYLIRSVDHGLVAGNPYLVMDYCTNGDLKQWMTSTKPNWEKTGKEILFGLRDLHRCGKVHRDLKPANVLINDDGSAVLTDFGIAGDRNKRMTERNIQGIPQQILGTYPYMPPEQVNPAKDATVLPTTDIFSFGVMMYQLLTGNFPFGKLESKYDLINYQKNGRDGIWDRKILAGSSAGAFFVPIIEGCLKPNYKKRFQSADDVLKAMSRGATDVKYRPYAPPVQMIAKNGILLRVMQGEEHKKIYRLNTILRGNCRVITMGRQDADIQNTINIVENQSCYISRKHCTLEMDLAKQWYIRDGQWNGKNAGENNWKHSKNGTFINSSEVGFEGMMISPGDIISIGDVKLRVEGY